MPIIRKSDKEADQFKVIPNSCLNRTGNISKRICILPPFFFIQTGFIPQTSFSLLTTIRRSAHKFLCMSISLFNEICVYYATHDAISLILEHEHVWTTCFPCPSSEPVAKNSYKCAIVHGTRYNINNHSSSIITDNTNDDGLEISEWVLELAAAAALVTWGLRCRRRCRRRRYGWRVDSCFTEPNNFLR